MLQSVIRFFIHKVFLFPLMKILFELLTIWKCIEFFFKRVVRPRWGVQLVVSRWPCLIFWDYIRFRVSFIRWFFTGIAFETIINIAERVMSIFYFLYLDSQLPLFIPYFYSPIILLFFIILWIAWSKFAIFTLVVYRFLLFLQLIDKIVCFE